MLGRGEGGAKMGHDTAITAALLPCCHFRVAALLHVVLCGHGPAGRGRLGWGELSPARGPCGLTVPAVCPLFTAAQDAPPKLKNSYAWRGLYHSQLLKYYEVIESVSTELGGLVLSTRTPHAPTPTPVPLA